MAMYRSPEFIAVILLGDEQPVESTEEPIDVEEPEEPAEASTSKRKQKAAKGQDKDSQSQPRALQNVDGKPRLDGILRWIEDGGISDIVILAPEWQMQAISSLLRSRKASASSAKDAALLPGEQPSQAGSGSGVKIDLEQIQDYRYSDNDCIRTWSQKNPYKNADLVILAPEFMREWSARLTNPYPPLATLLDRHRVDENLVTTLIYEKKAAPSKKQKEAEVPPPVMVAYDAKTSTLLDIRDLDEFDEDVSIRNSLLTKYPVLSLSTKLQLSHIYISSKHFLPLLEAYPTLHSLSEEVIPFLSKAQWQSRLLAKTAQIRRSRSTTIDGDDEDREEVVKEKEQSELSHSQRNALEKSTTRPPAKQGRNERLKIACIVQR